MPLRCMAYEADEYGHQAAKMRKRVRRQKGISRAEFLSGFTKQDRLRPCMTLVLYYGEDWDGARNLRSLFDVTGIPEELRGVINDYHMHICEVCKFEDTGVFRTDVKQVFDFIRCFREPEKLYELVRTDPAYQELDEDAYEVMAEYANSTELMEIKRENWKGGTVNMRNAITELIQRGRMEGAIQGREEGREEGIRALIEMSIKFGSTKQETLKYITETMQVSKENSEKYLERYWH